MRLCKEAKKSLMWQPAIESRRYGRFRPLHCFAPLTDSILIGGGHHSISAIILQPAAASKRGPRLSVLSERLSRCPCLSACIKLRRASEVRSDATRTPVPPALAPVCAACVLVGFAFDLGVSRICATTSSAAVSVCYVRYAPCLDAIFNWSLSASATIALTLERSARA